jgi:hypothetical protein
MTRTDQMIDEHERAEHAAAVAILKYRDDAGGVVEVLSVDLQDLLFR